MPAKGSGLAREQRIIPICNGVLTSREIAEQLGESVKYVQAVMKKYDLPRLPQAPRTGRHNPAYKSGRKIDRDGYVLVSAPPGHPQSRKRKGRSYGLIYEHRAVLERKLGRYLEHGEVVDHIDGLRLHNDPSNLRLFSSNAEHLRATITGQVPQWSGEGLERLNLARRGNADGEQIHTYNLMKKHGDARLRQILLGWLSLGRDSPYLSGTRHYLEKAGISDFSDSSLKRELDRICREYGQGRAL